ncbi:MAG: right-handed parallel beta-helix repeat-containing protein [Candidatus Hodarchaeota archaeon]
MTASGVDTILFYYQVNSEPWNVVNVTNSGEFIFTADMFNFNQTYEWYFWFNDTAGNNDQTDIKSFIVVDNTPPTYTNLNQTNETPEYDESNTVSITVNEPINASGVDAILLYYRINNGPWIEEDCTMTNNYTFTAEMLSYGQIYDWYFWFNDTAGNNDSTTLSSFTVVDKTAMEYSELKQTSDSPLYNNSNTVSVKVHEPENASGIDTILLYYRINTGSWIEEDCTTTSNYTFTADMLSYGQEFYWYFWFNDTAGNNDQTEFMFFIVSDIYAPFINESASQTTDTPEYNGSVSTSISIIEPSDASGVDMVWINYTSNGWQNYTVVDISSSQSYTFSEALLRFGQFYQWKIGFNDTAGNIAFSEMLSFTVIDSYYPDINELADQTTDTPEYNGSVVVSINVTEPVDASGLDTVWINYTTDNWITYDIMDITLLQVYTFNETILEFNQVYKWLIGFNDTEGTAAFSKEFSFTVIDSYSPDVIETPNQTTSTPDYNQSNTIKVNITEPTDASGVDRVLLYYRVDNGSWIMVDVTFTNNYTFSSSIFVYNQTYDWYFWFNDTVGNYNQTYIQTFIVTDSYEPEYSDLQQTSPNPNYDESNTVSITVSEPTNASGVDKILLYYRVDFNDTWTIVDVTTTSSYTFTSDMFSYGQVYDWYFRFNDTEGNTGQTSIKSFNIADRIHPKINQPFDVTCSEGIIGDIITWTTYDDEPDTYAIYRNGTLIISDIWNNFSISTDINGISEGSYNYTLIVFDKANNKAIDTVWVKIVKQFKPPSIGDWILLNHTVILRNENLNLNSNLLIDMGGTLILQRSTLRMNCTYDGQYHIEVFNRGSIILEDNTTITSTNPQLAYYLKANKGCSLYFVNSSIQYAGYSSNELSGVWINSDEAVIINCLFNNNYNGIFLYYANQCTIKDNTFDNNYFGIRLDYSQNCYLSANDIINSSNYGIFLNYSSNNILSDNYIYDIIGENGDKGIASTQSGSPGGIGAGIYLSSSFNNKIIDNIITHIIGGIGGVGGGTYASGGSGGMSAGILLSNSTYNIFNNTDIFDITGGIGGMGGGGYASGGSGGIGVGIFLLNSFNNSFNTITINNIIGGLGGLGGENGPDGNDNNGYGLYFEGNSLQNEISSTNTIENDPIIYLYGQSDLIIEGFNLSTTSNPTNLGKIVLINCYNVSIRNNFISNYQGCNGNTGNYQLQGSSGKSGTAIYILESDNVIIERNVISNIFGGIGGTGGFHHSGGNGGYAIAIYIKNSFDTVIQYNSIENITGGPGGTGGRLGSGGIGGTAAAVYLEDSNNDFIGTNQIDNIIGGLGGSGGYLSSGGTGGISTGIYLKNSQNNLIRNNSLNNLIGGIGGVSNNGSVLPLPYIYANGTNGIGFGIYISGDSLDNVLINNRVEGQLVIYLYNKSDMIIEGLDLTADYNPTNLGKIVLINCFNITIRNNNIANYHGVNGFTGLSSNHGDNGSYGVGIYLLNCSYCLIENNTINDIIGGTGGTGGFYGDGGSGGFSVGIYLEDSIRIILEYTIINGIYGGIGGISGFEGENGTGGNSFGVYILNSSLISIAAALLNITEGDGFTKGIAEEIYCSASCENIFWTYETVYQRNYDENHTIYFGLNNYSNPDILLIYYRVDNGIWNVIDVTGTHNYTFTSDLLFFQQVWEWYFWVNKTNGQTNQTGLMYFLIVDTKPKIYTDVYQTGSMIEYDKSNTVYIIIEEPIGASSIDTILLYYRVDNTSWTFIDVTSTSNFTFTSDLLFYGQHYNWYFWINDTAGNINMTAIYSFTVIDVIPPLVSNLDQTNNSIEYDEINTVSIDLIEPAHASGLHGVWLCYRVNNGSWTYIDVTNIYNYTFSEEILYFGQIIDWYFFFNDTAGNYNETAIQSFSIIDLTPPKYTDLSLTNSTYEYNEFITVSINSSDPYDASGLDKVLLYYSIDDGDWIMEDVSLTQNYTFNANMLFYGQVYNWFFWINDTAGNNNQTLIQSFEVIDNTAPNPNIKTYGIPEYKDNYTIIIEPNEPVGASGTNRIIFYYNVNDGPWIINDVTNAESYVFTEDLLVYNQKYFWYFWVNDTAGNGIQTDVYNFTVVDYSPPTCALIVQDHPQPEYSESNGILTYIFEPADACGLDTIYIYYRVDNQTWQKSLITETQEYIFNASILSYGQFWEWFLWYNDTLGNHAITEINNFTVEDYTPPSYSQITQTNDFIRTGENNTVSLVASEPEDASGIKTIHLWFTKDYQSFDFVDITSESTFCITPKFLSELPYDDINGVYYWWFEIIDVAGNQIETPEKTFEVDITTFDLNVIIPLGILSSLLLTGFALTYAYSKKRR